MSHTDADALKVRLFLLSTTVSLVLLYILFLVGAWVRASGAGMGCPDWPTCFGQWIPPINASELPKDYQTTYANRGYADTLFNAKKTWIEYINRLVSALVGIATLLSAVLSFFVYKRFPWATVSAVCALALVGINAWMGSVIVASNLHPSVVTTHTLLGIMSLCFLLTAGMIVRHEEWHIPKACTRTLLPPMLLLFLALIVQIGLGIQVRETVEIHRLGETSAFSLFLTPQTKDAVSIHLLSGLVSFFASAYNLFAISRPRIFYLNKRKIQWSAFIILMLISTNLMLGILLAATALPWGKPLHLFIAVLATSLSFLLLATLLYSNFRPRATK